MAKGSSGLKRGDAMVIKDRLWAVVDGAGRLAWHYPDLPVYAHRDDAVNALRESREGNFIGAENWKTVRLNDVTGAVV